jgi:hypothetical protein
VTSDQTLFGFSIVVLMVASIVTLPVGFLIQSVALVVASGWMWRLKVGCGRVMLTTLAAWGAGSVGGGLIGVVALVTAAAVAGPGLVGALALVLSLVRGLLLRALI